MASNEPRPEWLPPGWTMTVTTRLSGGTAGKQDRYYFNPENDRKFRSKIEVLRYLEKSSSSSAFPNFQNQEVSSRKYYINPENELKFGIKYEGLQNSKTSNWDDAVHIMEEENLSTLVPDSKVVIQKDSNESIPGAGRNERNEEMNCTGIELNDVHNVEAKMEWKRTKQRAIKSCKHVWSSR